MNNRESFEVMMRKTFGEKVNFNMVQTITGEKSDEYRSPSVRDCWALFSALAPQAQQPSEAKPYGYVTTLRNGTKHFYESMPYLDNAVKCDTVYLQSQVQQTENKWISVEEKLPEIDTPILAAVGKNIYALARVEYDEGWLWGIGCNDLSDARNYEADDDYQPTHWMPLALPPAPMNEVNKPEGGDK